MSKMVLTRWDNEALAIAEERASKGDKVGALTGLASTIEEIVASSRWGISVLVELGKGFEPVEPTALFWAANNLSREAARAHELVNALRRLARDQETPPATTPTSAGGRADGAAEQGQPG